MVQTPFVPQPPKVKEFINVKVEVGLYDRLGPVAQQFDISIVQLVDQAIKYALESMGTSEVALTTPDVSLAVPTIDIAEAIRVVEQTTPTTVETRDEDGTDFASSIDTPEKVEQPDLRHLKPKQRSAVEDYLRFKNGEITRDEVFERNSISEGYLYYVLRLAGVTPKNKGPSGPKEKTPAQLRFERNQQIAKDYKTGMKSDDVGKRYGISGQAVLNILHKMGVKTRRSRVVHKPVEEPQQFIHAPVGRAAFPPVVNDEPIRQRQLPLSGPDGGWSFQRNEHLKRLHKAKTPVWEIARELGGVSNSEVRRQIEKLGLGAPVNA